MHQQVYSSTVSHISHDPDTNEMRVKWRDGKTSVYAGVPASVARDVANAPSVGQALHRTIKGKFEHRYD